MVYYETYFFDIIGPILIGLSISYRVSAVWIGNGSLYILSYNPQFLCFLYFKGAATRMRKTAFCYSPFRVIHYNFVSIALEDIFYDVVDHDEWNDTNY